MDRRSAGWKQLEFGRFRAFIVIDENDFFKDLI